MIDLLNALTAAVETETAVLSHHLDEMRALRARTEAANKRVAELGKIIRASQAYIAYHGPANASKLITIRHCRQRVEAAVTELDTLSAEFQAIETASSTLMANQALRAAFQPNTGLT